MIILFGFHWEIPSQADKGLVSGGLTLSIEYSAVFAGLVVYTAAFIAEIVRGEFNPFLRDNGKQPDPWDYLRVR